MKALPSAPYDPLTEYWVKADGSSNFTIYMTSEDGGAAQVLTDFGGYGLPTGGASGDVPVKQSSTDGDVGWGSVGSIISGATAKTTPVDADTIGISDSADSAALKKLTFANLWTWVKSKLSGTDPIVVGGLLYTTGYQWVTGSLSGTTVPAPAANIQVSVIWDTAGTSASMTLTLPSGPANGQVIEFAYINAITSLAFTGGSILGYGGASAVPGGGNTKLVFNSAFGVWARLGD